MRLFPGLVALVFFLGAMGRTAQAQVVFPVNPAQLDVRQVDLGFEGLPTLVDSQYGWVGVNNAQLLASSTGGLLSTGFLNLSTAQGWVVRNMPIVTPGYTGIGTYFDLGATPGDVTSLQVLANVSSLPLLTHGPVSGGDPIVPVGSMTYDAQGAGGAPGGPSDPTSNPRPANPDATARIDTTTLVFGLLPFEIHVQEGHPNIEQAQNQCYPASIANSLKYLQDTTGVITTAHPHMSGELDMTLVGELDQEMNRPAGEYTPTAVDMVHGKLDYLDENDLEGRVMTEHKQAPGIPWLDGDIDSDDGNATSTEDTSATSLIDWIIQKVEDGKDVEVRIGWDGGGGHAFQLTGAGRIGGLPFLMYAHDADQGAAGGTGHEDGGHGFTFVDDNLGIVAFIDGQLMRGTISFAISEMAVPPMEPPDPTYDFGVIPQSFMDVVGTGTDVTGLIANLDDGGVTVPIGFPFDFYGSSITSIGFSTNGYLTADGSTLTDFTSDCPIPNPATPNRGIYPYWSDLRLNEHGSMLHDTMGTPGSQVFIAQWEDVGSFDDSSAHVTMQVKLLELCGEIEFHYALLDSGTTGAFDATGGEGTVGVEGPGGAAAAQIGCNTPGLLSTGTAFRLGVTGSQTPRFATAPNPGTFVPDPAGGPTIGGTWAPSVSGALPSPAVDVVIVSMLAPIEVPLPFGTLLSSISVPLLQFNFGPGTPFSIPIPSDCGLVGLNVTTQGGSLAFGPLTIGLANGLDIIAGSL